MVPLDYSFCVREVMPDWVKEVIRSASPRKTEDFSDIQKDLQELLNKFRVKVLGRKVDMENGEPTDENKGTDPALNGGGGSGGGSSTSAGRGARRFREAPEGATSTSLYEVFEKPPNFHMLVTEEGVADKKLKGRGAMFIIETGDLFVNGLYEAVTRTIEDIEPEFMGQSDPESVRQLIVNAARRQLAFRVGKGVVFALAKRANEDWDQTSLNMAITKESLSIAADNYLEGLSAVRREVKDGIKVAKIAA
jgi:hypothetical protein